MTAVHTVRSLLALRERGVRVLAVVLALSAALAGRSANTYAQGPTEREEKGFRAQIFPHELAPVLPLPGKYGGLVSTLRPPGITGIGGRDIHGIAILLGDDETNNIKPEIHIASAFSDILVTRVNQALLLVRSDEKVPESSKLVVGPKGELLGFDSALDFQSALQAGRTLRLPEGSIILSVADSSTKRVTKEIEYSLGPNATVTWDKAQSRPSWHGFTVRVRPRLSLDEILDKNLEALGGSEALKAVHTITERAKMVVGGGMVEAPTLTQVRRPGKIRTEMTAQGQKTITAFDGTDGWIMSPVQGSEPQKLPERMLKSVTWNADIESRFGALKAIREAGHTVELVGRENVEGSPTYRIKVTRKSGDVQTYFLDAERFLPVRITMESEGILPISKQEVEVFPGDYKKVAGILMAHSVETKVGGRSITQITIEKIEVNLPMDDAIFKMPSVAKPAENPAKPYF